MNHGLKSRFAEFVLIHLTSLHGMEIICIIIGDIIVKQKQCPKCGSSDISSIFLDGQNRQECNDCFFRWEGVTR